MLHFDAPNPDQASAQELSKDEVDASVADCLVSISVLSERLKLRGMSVYSKCVFHVYLMLTLAGICILNTVI